MTIARQAAYPFRRLLLKNDERSVLANQTHSPDSADERGSSPQELKPRRQLEFNRLGFSADDGYVDVVIASESVNDALHEVFGR